MITPAYIHCKVPRVRRADGMMLTEYEMLVNRVGKIMWEYPNHIWTIFNHWASKAHEKADHSQVEHIGVDDTMFRKGCSYITLAVNMDERRVIHTTQGKGGATIEVIKDYLVTKARPAADQQGVDLSPAFISRVDSYFLNAQITFDRFHVKALLNKTMNEVRNR